ncbi:fibroblast growth factor 17 [Caerostris extrusa]|uniref:Fibroblast growth factor 17 n=1 Tax=Caerostris extrusa TaxID=172846 RepID=A0AAV4PN48_CAEEX|nr:fibroblast growth factor 17 [Caerostris extrusa]
MRQCDRHLLDNLLPGRWVTMATFLNCGLLALDNYFQAARVWPRGRIQEVCLFSGGSPRCIFEEQFSPEYFTTLKSVYNKNWSIGFNRKGKPLLGSDKSKSHRNRCFYFTKRGHSYLDGLHETNPYGPKIANPHKLMHFLHEKEIKRRKRHSLNKTKQ